MERLPPVEVDAMHLGMPSPTDHLHCAEPASSAPPSPQLAEPQPMLAFIGGGPWLFDPLAALGVPAIAFGDGIASRTGGNVLAVELAIDDASAEESAKAVALVDQVTKVMPIRRFVSITELGSLPAAQLNARRGLGGLAPAAVVATRDKATMRRRLDGTRLAWPYFACDDGDAVMIAETVGLPCVAKPRSNTASKGVQLLKDMDALTRYVELARAKSALTRIIFEKFIDGDEYSLEAFTLAGETRIYSITQKTNVNFVELDFGFSSEISERHGAVCAEALDQLLTCLGIGNGPTHTEVKIGSDGVVRIIETHARVAGGHIPEMVRAVTGVDLYALTVQEACGRLPALPEPDGRRIAAALKYKRHEPGKVISVRGDYNLRFRPDVLAFGLKARPGVKLRAPESNFDRTDFVACHAPTLAEAYARCDHYLDGLWVVTA